MLCDSNKRKFMVILIQLCIRETTNINRFLCFYFLKFLWALVAFIYRVERQESGAERVWGRLPAKEWGPGVEPVTASGGL